MKVGDTCRIRGVLYRVIEIRGEKGREGIIVEQAFALDDEVIWGVYSPQYIENRVVTPDNQWALPASSEWPRWGSTPRHCSRDNGIPSTKGGWSCLTA